VQYKQSIAASASSAWPAITLLLIENYALNSSPVSKT